MPTQNAHLRLSTATLAATLLACGVKVPTRPGDLAPNTFALALDGAVGVNAKQIKETSGGTACRVGEYILLLNPSRKLTITFPSITDQDKRYKLGTRAERSSTAHAFLSVPLEINRGMSLSILEGSASIASRSATEAVGSIDGHLAQEFLDKDPELQNATVHGVFRAGKCKYSPDDGYRAP
jgi:hypothetical protein